MDYQTMFFNYEKNKNLFKIISIIIGFNIRAKGVTVVAYAGDVFRKSYLSIWV